MVKGVWYVKERGFKYVDFYHPDDHEPRRDWRKFFLGKSLFPKKGARVIRATVDYRGAGHVRPSIMGVDELLEDIGDEHRLAPIRPGDYQKLRAHAERLLGLRE